MTILGQQALLSEDAPDRFLACRSCGAGIDENGVRSLDEYIGSCAGAISVDKDGALSFEGGGYTEYGDPVRTEGFQCQTCDTFSHTLEGLVEWRVND